MNRSPFLFAILLLCLGSLVGCGQKQTGPKDERIHVVTTTTMITDMVQQIAGEEIRVTGLMGPGVDPHTYKAGSSDATALQKADVIIYNGLLLEGRMSTRLDALAETRDSVLSLGGTLGEDQVFHPKDSENHPDPHLWGDAQLWSTFPERVGDLLAEKDPDNAALYRERAQSVKAKYLEMHEWAKKEIASIPEGNRYLITSHDAFAYFGRAYGIEVIGVQGISTDSEPGTAAIVKTIDFVKEHSVPAVFVESSVSRKTIDRISKDSGAVVGGELFSDAAGTPGEMMTIDGREVDLGTYEGMFMHNVDLVVKGLSRE